ncbi:MAG TPA: hypothetical protein VK177_02980, partial [Flavobacteriales bacterium]|nr:hypothetical protein [Flavobacteriales bacterium]
MKRFLPFLLVLTFIGSSYAQTATIRGYLIDQSKGAVVPYGSVFLKENKISEQTDDNGVFVFTNLKPG